MRLNFVGDIFVSTPIPEIHVDQQVHNLLSSADYNFGCFEGPYCSPLLSKFKKIGPSLLQSTSVTGILPLFSHMCVANNHIMDYGISGCTQTISMLEEMGIEAIGAATEYPDMYRPAVIEKDGIKVAVFCWAEAQFGCCKSEYEQSGYAWLFNPLTYQLIGEYKKKVDFVILFLHAGLEDVDIPVLDWRIQYRHFIDCGADLIIGNHPHIIQGKEIYKNKSIYYSLGNFFFVEKNTTFSPSWVNSLVVKCDISKDGITVNEEFVSFTSDSISLAQTDTRAKFDALCLELLPENKQEYEKRHDEVLMDCWEKYYKYFYSFPIWKTKVKVAFYRRCFNRLMEGYVRRCFLPSVALINIYHNINIETHRFVVSRVCARLSDTY